MRLHPSLRDRSGRAIGNVGSTGVVLVDERVAPTTMAEDPIYVPASVARRQVRQLIERLEAMTQEHSARMSAVEASCQHVTSVTEAHYVEMITSLRRKAHEESVSLREATVVLRSEAEEKHAAATAEIATLRAALTEQTAELATAKRVAEDVGTRAALAAQRAAAATPTKRRPRRVSSGGAASAAVHPIVLEDLEAAAAPAGGDAGAAASWSGVASAPNAGGSRWQKLKAVTRAIGLGRSGASSAASGGGASAAAAASLDELIGDSVDAALIVGAAATAATASATAQDAAERSAFSSVEVASHDVAELKKRVVELTQTIRQQSIESARKVEELRETVRARDAALEAAIDAAPAERESAEAKADNAESAVAEQLHELKALVSESREMLRTTVRSARTLRGFRDPAAQKMKESCDLFVKRAKEFAAAAAPARGASSTASYAASKSTSTGGRSARKAASSSSSSSSSPGAASAKRSTATKKGGDSAAAEVKALKSEVASLKSQLAKSGGASSSSPSRSSGAAREAEVAAKQLKKDLRERDVKIRKLEASLEKASAQAERAGSGGGGSDAERKKVERLAATAAKKAAKAQAEAAKELEKLERAASKKLEKAGKAEAALQAQLDAAQKDAAKWKKEAAELSKLTTGLDELRAQAAEVTTLRTEVASARLELADVGDKYRAEMLLRKKYYNEIEDLKGKIRVYCRCRPFSGSEGERGDTQCVRFVDEFTLEIMKEKTNTDGSITSVGRSFEYDQVFAPSSTQELVFEDCRRLMQSAIDGYNVCIFAYGQTGSGKTWTMVGKPDFPGLTPRAITELYDLAAENAADVEVTFSSYMVELYNDNFVDLYYRVEHGTGAQVDKTAPKLDVKMDAKGMVVIKNVKMVTVATAEECMKLFNKGNKKRHVGGTKMNAESSRSHLIFAVIVEVLNKQTRKVTRGKLSLIDLAGSERVGKTGASADRLREAKSINMSLSALGNVIRALSSPNDGMIPYRSNKLTLLMRDSLGGTAKTLMFVNMSPSAYNTDETMSSLVYASQVKMITNSAHKSAGESEELAACKRIIAELVASGGTSATLVAQET
jgi:hypothetical protein